MPEDFSFQAMEHRMRIAKGRPLTEDERSTIRANAEKIAELEEKFKSAKEEEEIAAENAEVSRIYEATVKELQSEAAASRKVEIKVEIMLIGIGFFCIIAILLLLFFAGHEIFRLLKWLF